MAKKSSFSAQCTYKVSVIGAGNVGATIAYALLLDGTPTHLSLIDINKEKAEGVILDMYHSLPFVSYTDLIGSDDFSACEGSQLVIITAGARQKDGETRLDLLEKNMTIFHSIIPQIVTHAPNAVIVVVSNPVDVLTQVTINLAKLPVGRVFGSGTMLDTARFRYHIAQKAGVSPQSISAYIMGEHGDSSFLVESAAQIAGVPIKKWPRVSSKTIKSAYQDTRDAAYKIIHDIGYTCYSIATVVKTIMRHIYSDSHAVLPLSIELDSYYSRKKVSLSVPCVLGRSGIIKQVHMPLSAPEKRKLTASVGVMKEALDTYKPKK